MNNETTRYAELIREHLCADYHGMFREAEPPFPYPYLVPGSQSYAYCLWDWDSWLSNVALRQILAEKGDPKAYEEARLYERGCVLNFLSWCGGDGWIPIAVSRGQRIEDIRPADIFSTNMHKPVLAQHAAFLVKQDGGDAEWLRERFQYLQAFLNCYKNHHRHRCGLYFWQDDYAIGVDTDPCTFYRPRRSSASIYLNCLMVKELEAMVYLCNQLGLDEIGAAYRRDTDEVRAAIQEHCWDERDGFFYSADLNLLPIDETHWLHRNMPRQYDCLIQRIGVWSGFLALWAGVASPEQAARVVENHYRDPRTFNAPYGVRTLSKMEKMYSLKASGNPSSWNGPVWGVANYLTYRGLLRYGFEEDARDLAMKTVRLFGHDIERFGALHEYYQPENGEPILNRGFQNWNYLVLNMLTRLEGKAPVTEF
jgi:putative isomerase